MLNETAKNQALELIRRGSRVLIVGPAELNADSVASMLGLALLLKKQGKEVSVVSSGQLPKEIGFLPETALVARTLNGTRDFIIELDATRTEVDTLAYDHENGRLKINVAPVEGTFSAKDVSFKQGAYKYDLIAVLDAAAVERMDKIYDVETDLFFEAPVLNVDHREKNQHFGTVNLVVPEASSTTEIVAMLAKELQADFDESLANVLLTGLMSATYALKNSKTTANALMLAAELVQAGANQQNILEHLERAKPLSAVKLWGRALARLEEAPTNDFVYSSLSFDDFKDCKATPDQARGLMDELSAHTRSRLLLLLIEDEPGRILVQARSPHSNVAAKLAERFHGEINPRTSRFILRNVSMKQAIEKVAAALSGREPSVKSEPTKQSRQEQPRERKQAQVPSHQGRPQSPGSADRREEPKAAAPEPSKPANIFAEDEDEVDDFFPHIAPPADFQVNQTMVWRPDDD